MSTHERLILFDSKEKSIRYYSQIPEQLPTVEEIPEGKEIIFMKKVKNFTFRSTKTNIGKAAVQWSESGGTKK